MEGNTAPQRRRKWRDNEKWKHKKILKATPQRKNLKKIDAVPL
jgi:hypothetical protein